MTVSNDLTSMCSKSLFSGARSEKDDCEEDRHAGSTLCLTTYDSHSVARLHEFQKDPTIGSAHCTSR